MQIWDLWDLLCCFSLWAAWVAPFRSHVKGTSLSFLLPHSMHPTVSAAKRCWHIPAAGFVCACGCVCVRMSMHVSCWLIFYRSADSGSWVSVLPGESTRPPKDKKKSTEGTVSLTHNRWPWRFYSAKGRSEGLSLCATSHTHTFGMCTPLSPLLQHDWALWQL